MDLDKFIENFAEQFDDLDISALSGDTIFKELNEWSSLVALSVIAMIDEEYEVHVGAKEIVGSNTIENLYNVVKESK